VPAVLTDRCNPVAVAMSLSTAGVVMSTERASCVSPASLMPTTSPWASTVGPPESPGFNPAVNSSQSVTWIGSELDIPCQ
jgi:hypothetical protein